MSDIVDQLMAASALPTGLYAEAAAEILRLRVELAELQQTNAEQATIIIDYGQQLAEARAKAFEEASMEGVGG